MTRVVDGWRSFWFRPEKMYTLGAVRIAFGLLAIAWTLSLLPDLNDLFGTSGVMPTYRADAYEWGVFRVWPGDQAIWIGWAVLLVASIALTVGWHSNLAALLVWALVFSFELRNPYVFNSGDTLVRIEALFLVLSPCGSALSLDQRRRTGAFWSAQERPRWALRLFQIQLSLIYIATFQVRMTGDRWPNGTAMSFALRLDDMLIIAAPRWITTQPLLMNVATWGTLIGELLIAILIWNKRCRRYVMIAGVTLHAVILVTVAVGFFSPAMWVLYLAFVDPETVRGLPDRVKSHARRRKGPAPPAEPELAEQAAT